MNGTHALDTSQLPSVKLLGKEGTATAEDTSPQQSCNLSFMFDPTPGGQLNCPTPYTIGPLSAADVPVILPTMPLPNSKHQADGGLQWDDSASVFASTTLGQHPYGVAPLVPACPAIAPLSAYAQGTGTTVAATGATGPATTVLQQVQPSPSTTVPTVALPTGVVDTRRDAGPPTPSSHQGADGCSSPVQRKTTGRYKRPEVVQAERKQKAAGQAHICRLEHLVGQLQEQLRELRFENNALKQKAFVLSRKVFLKSFTEELLDATQLYPSLRAGNDSGPLTSAKVQAQLAARGLPPQRALDLLTEMTLPEAVDFYNRMVERLRVLLERIDNPACHKDKAEAEQGVAKIFSCSELTGVFGYIQVVNPSLMAQLMAVRLDQTLNQQDVIGQQAGGGGAGKSERDNAHWRRVLEAMRLTDEEMAQLILLVQMYSQRMEQLVSLRTEVAKRLCSELAAELEKEDQELDGAEQMQDAADELSALSTAENWAKLDLIGGMRKMLPPVAQARCMVASYPFHLDLRHFELAVKEKAGHLWRQLVIRTH